MTPRCEQCGYDLSGLAHGTPACPEGGPPLRPPPRRSYKYLDLVTAAFVTVLLCSNLIGPGKLVEFHPFGFLLVFGAGNIFFPISYIFDDVLTEVYGYAKARKVIWAGFGAM